MQQIQPVQQPLIDDVPVFTAPGPARVTAALVFGVGVRDETYATLGVTHLIEHLVMGSLPKSHLECNATVDVESTTFYATGRPDAVAGFLAGVCAALSDLPTDRIDLEVGILQAENCTGSHPTAAALWAARFRLDGPGLAYAGGGVPEHLDEATVRAHAQRWFVRSNAALVWHGDLPEGLRLPLPAGSAPQRPLPVARPQTGPEWLSGPTVGAGLLLTVRDGLDAATGVALDVLLERVRDVARHERGLSYHADLEVIDVAAGHREVALLVDAREGQDAEVARLLWAQYEALCTAGPSADELAHAVDGYAEFAEAGEDVVLPDLVRAAFCHVFGLPFRPAAEGLRAWRAVQPAEVAAAARALRTSALLIVPSDVEVEGLEGVRRRPLCNVVPALPEGTVFRQSFLARLRGRAGRVSVVVGDAGLAELDSDGDVHLIPWDEVVAAVPAPTGEGVFVVGRGLCGLEITEKAYGRRAVEAVRARLPEHVWVPVPRSAAEERVLVPQG